MDTPPHESPADGWKWRRLIAAIFVAMYALSPWLLFYLSSCVDVSFIFLPAAAHLWCCWRLRQTPAPWPSFVLGCLLVLTAQIHGSFVIPLALTVLLVVQGRIR